MFLENEIHSFLVMNFHICPCCCPKQILDCIGVKNFSPILLLSLEATFMFQMSIF